MATVQVPSVWPPGSNVSITGQVVSGDGHLTGASAGVQFGTPRATLSAAVAGVPSAQSFGTLTVLFDLNVHPLGVPSAQSFGTLKTRFTIAVGGVPSKQAFGTPAYPQRIAVLAVLSAQAFSSTIQINQTIRVNGFFPYGPYVPSITGQVISGDGHITGGNQGTGEQFGVPTIRATITKGVAGVASAQSFGTPKAHYIIHPLGLGSAQQFGTKLGFKFRVLGIPSAQAFGDPLAYIVWLKPDICIDIDLVVAAICTEVTLAPDTPVEQDLEVAVCT